MEKIIFKGQIIPSKDGNEVYFLDELDFISWGIDYDEAVKAFAGKKVIISIKDVEETTDVEDN